ncbi:cupin domain-containing protein [Paenibacillus alkalitolerans]|uniref:cupin domain-containing protein n=1 Tax=Paenibacillus alkalitolerans TaxID=2799335 RepID=UPI0018F77029|nr:cupin domain-containing protein [Paenibacillus alkalitolerans]
MSNDYPNGSVLLYPDGQSVTCLERSKDNDGEYLLVEHKIIRNGAINGPHWHPVLTETFTIKQGKMRFKVNGEETVLGPGEKLTIFPGQVHQFWNESDTTLVALHEIRPPGLHWQMFALIHKLECEGKLNGKGIPRNPLWLGLAWEAMEGYMAGPPKIAQDLVLGGLARLAKGFGYKVFVQK